MENLKRSGSFSTLLTILTWGGVWGIFEATVGYLLHLLPISVGWLVWYPVACFFMMNVYNKTRRASSIILVGLLSAGIKLLNLFLPGRIDKVLNPAFSIVFEALALAAVMWALNHFLAQKEKKPWVKALAALAMNTGWRSLFALYLLFLVPDWMQEVSVVSSAPKFIEFFVIHNLLTSLVLFGASLSLKHIFKPIKALENKISLTLSALPSRASAGIKTAAAICLVGGFIALELLT